MVVFDASILLFVLDENVKASVTKARERVEHLSTPFLRQRKEL